MARVQFKDRIESLGEEVIKIEDDNFDDSKVTPVDTISDIVMFGPKGVGRALYSDLKEAETQLWEFFVKENRKKKRKCRFLRDPLNVLGMLLCPIFAGLFFWMGYLSNNCAT